jgi:Zn-dependent peptidase ImmA (M78 family)
MANSFEFNSSRLSLARRRRGMSKAMLSKETGISLRSLGYYEDKTSEIKPSETHTQILASTLKLPVEFFYGPDIEEINPEAVSFRKLSKLPALEREAALAAGTFAKELSTWIEQKFRLLEPSIPSLRGFANPEAAAEALRAEWGLGLRPIRNTVHLLEGHGVRVFSLPVNSHQVDAFSLWHSKPYVFLNPKKSAEHGRFDAAHELGHLALHKHIVSSRSRETELEADRFASAFLMPSGDVSGHVPPARTISVKTIHKLKKRWGVSAMALVHRLHDLKIISDWQYRGLCIELSTDGYRSDEKDGAQRDTSQVLEKVLSALRSEGITRGRIAREIGFTAAEIDSLLVGLVIASVSASASPNTEAPRSTNEPRTRPKLVV